jgi:predicted RNA-binding protein with TRAM domain
MERRGFGHSSFDRFDQPKPVKIGEEYTVKISDVGAKGDGICKVENFIIFVANTKKGETCKIKIKEVARKFAIAEKVGEASAEDVEEAEESEDEEKEDKEESEDEEKEEDSDEGVEDSEEGDKINFKDMDDDKEDTF